MLRGVQADAGGMALRAGAPKGSHRHGLLHPTGRGQVPVLQARHREVRHEPRPPQADDQDVEEEPRGWGQHHGAQGHLQSISGGDNQVLRRPKHQWDTAGLPDAKLPSVQLLGRRLLAGSGCLRPCAVRPLGRRGVPRPVLGGEPHARGPAAAHQGELPRALQLPRGPGAGQPTVAGRGGARTGESFAEAPCGHGGRDRLRVAKEARVSLRRERA
mmetsp:Transcript_61930/g.191749  ORF Transcript_61930/g.191749 Transcript_61930/m.191749 type:complete len:215 (-) Transcript_61930:2-646(-)